MTPLPSTAAGALHRVVRVLEAARFRTAVVGAVATFAWGDPRTTRDADVAVLSDDTAAVAGALRATGVEPKGPFSTTWGPRFIVSFPEGIPVDVFLSQDKRTFARVRRIDVAGTSLPMVAPEDLIAMKLRNFRLFPDERAQDLDDAAGVLFKSWTALDRPYLRRRCREAGVAGHLAEVEKRVRRARSEAGLSS